MALTHLVDTSVLTRVRHQQIYERLATLLQDRLLARVSLSDLELGFTARNAREWDRIQRDLHPFAEVSTVPGHIKRALRVQRALADRGLRGRKIPDLLVAAAAEDSGLILLHYDADFEDIAQVTGQPCEWILPRGTID